MNVVRINGVQLGQFGYTEDRTARVQGAFPFSAVTGNTSTAVVYFELAPGCRLPTHTDSAEELLLILSGTAELAVGDEQGKALAGDMALVPAMVPHSVRNVGDELVRVVGFFGSSTVMSTFGQPLVPLDQPAGAPPFGNRTVLIPPPVVLEQPPAPMA